MKRYVKRTRRRMKRGGARFINYLTFKDLPNRPWSFGERKNLDVMACDRKWYFDMGNNNKVECVTFILFAGVSTNFLKSVNKNEDVSSIMGGLQTNTFPTRVKQKLSAMEPHKILESFLQTKFGNTINIAATSLMLKNNAAGYAIITSQENGNERLNGLNATYVLQKIESSSYKVYFKCNQVWYMYDGKTEKGSQTQPPEFKNSVFIIYGDIHNSK